MFSPLLVRLRKHNPNGKPDDPHERGPLTLQFLHHFRGHNPRVADMNRMHRMLKTLIAKCETGSGRVA